MKLIIIAILATISITACGSTPTNNSRDNSPQTQRDNAKQGQDELSRETSRY